VYESTRSQKTGTKKEVNDVDSALPEQGVRFRALISITWRKARRLVAHSLASLFRTTGETMPVSAAELHRGVERSR